MLLFFNRLSCLSHVFVVGRFFDVIATSVRCYPRCRMSEKQPLNDAPGLPPPYAPGVGQTPYPTGQPPYPTGQPPIVQGQPAGLNSQGQYPSAPGQLLQQPPPPVAYPAQGDVPPPYKEGAPVAGYATPPGAVPANTTVIVHQQQFNQFPVSCMCPNCHQSVVTTTVAETSTLTWLISGGICLLGGWVCCLCLIPFCIDDLKDVRHVCPGCRHTVGVYRRM